MIRKDPYSAEGTRSYECRSCLHRVEAEEPLRECPECGGTMQNVSIPRE